MPLLLVCALSCVPLAALVWLALARSDPHHRFALELLSSFLPDEDLPALHVLSGPAANEGSGSTGSAASDPRRRSA